MYLNTYTTCQPHETPTHAQRTQKYNLTRRLASHNFRDCYGFVSSIKYLYYSFKELDSLFVGHTIKVLYLYMFFSLQLLCKNTSSVKFNF